MRWRVNFGFILLFALLIILNFTAPSQHNPFRQPDLTDPIGWTTYDKLTKLKYNPIMCRAKLDEAGVEYKIIPADAPGARCQLGETLSLQKSLTPFNAAPLRMSCHQMAALHVWERNVLRPQAEQIFGSPLRQIQTYGSFSCRNIAGTRQRSEHAFANAIDISGFILEDGRQISVRQHWRAKNDYGLFLKRAHLGACRLFSVTLGPDYDAAHADHFHLDMGSAETCK